MNFNLFYLQAIEGENQFIYSRCFIVQIVAYIPHIVVLIVVAQRLRAMVHQKRGNRCFARVTSAPT